MAEAIGPHPALRLFLGDVRDRARLVDAFHGCDVVVHAAALKRVDAVAYNPSEARRTNVEGSAHVVSAAIEAHVGRVLMISSDKACLPTNFYGVTKAAMEAEAVAANAIGVPRGTKIACARYGNVLGSRGSVVHLFRQAVADNAPIPITHPDMTRFWLTVDEAVDVVVRSLDVMKGGEIFVPVLPALRLTDLAEAIAPGHPTQIVGLRPGGEKIAETLINDDEAQRTIAVADDLWAITPHIHPWTAHEWAGEPYPAGFPYRSNTVGWRLTVDEVRKMLESIA